jgi:hypothetical protein
MYGISVLAGRDVKRSSRVISLEDRTTYRDLLKCSANRLSGQPNGFKIRYALWNDNDNNSPVCAGGIEGIRSAMVHPKVPRHVLTPTPRPCPRVRLL